MKDWESYHKQVGDTPNSLVIGTLRDFEPKRNASLDLGAGNLRDSKFLLSQGFQRVVAVDRSDESYEYLVRGVELHISPIETFVPEKDTFDFTFSCNTLFFLTPKRVADVIKNVHVGLRPGGIFACNVLGPEDDWVVEGNQVSSFTEESLTALFTGFEVIGSGESKNRGTTLNQNGFLIGKFWHQLSIVAQKL